MNSKHILFSLFPLLIISLLLFACHPTKEVLSVSYIYASHCNTCGEAEKRVQILEKTYRFADGAFRLQAELYNVLIESQYEPAMMILDSMDIPASARNLPLLISGKEWFYGQEDIDRALDELEAGKIPFAVP